LTLGRRLLTETIYLFKYVFLAKQEDCKRTADGYDYQGQMNVTIGNRTCQRWALDTPHAHSQNGLPENYCRNPDHEPAPWCYTTDTSKRYELCDVPFCSK